MKITKLFGSIVILIALVQPAGSYGADFSKKISCPLNKSFSLQITFQQGERGLEGVVVDHIDFMGRNPERVAYFKRPAMQVIDYSRVFMVSQNYGRSGYAWMRLEETSEGHYKGLFDFDLFLAPMKPFEAGKVTALECYEQPTLTSLPALQDKGNRSEACQDYCYDKATEHYAEGTSEWAHFYGGCMMTCWM